MTLTDPMFFVGLAKACFDRAAQSESEVCALGLRRLGQQYLDEAKRLTVRKADAFGGERPLPGVA
ncbi:MAG: hypothetical protein AB7K04_14610 [Pseudorhodoplanes sp.]